MKIIEKDKLEDCFDGSTIYSYSFDSPWTKNEIMALKEWGELDYYADFPRPFFRLMATTGLQIKGVEGEVRIKVIYSSKGKEEEMIFFEKNLFF